MAPKSNSSKLMWVPECSGFLLSCLLALTLQNLFFSPPVSSASVLPTKLSSMQGLIKLGKGIVNHPEDVTVDKNGLLYTATNDGWIKRMHKNGTWENWKLVDSHTLLGITSTKANEIIVCDSEKGLLKVNEDGVTVLASEVNGTKLLRLNDVIAASDGTLYFTVSSTKYTAKEYYLDLVEGQPHGQLLKYDPLTKQVSVVLNGFYFANGVALSKNEDFVIVCESWKCIKHWLTGKSPRNRQIFIENLPGGPDNINLAPDGSFWISLIKMNASGVQALQNCKEKEQLLAAYPELIRLLVPLDNKAPATVVNIAANGHFIRGFSDPNATQISFVTSALWFDDSLYLASINSDFMGKLPLKHA